MLRLTRKNAFFAIGDYTVGLLVSRVLTVLEGLGRRPLR
jgi:hypothetical protein